MKGTVASLLYRKASMTASDWLVDCVIAAGSFGVAMLQLSLAMNLFVPDAFTRMLLGITSVTPSAGAIAVTLAMSAALVLRRRLPWAVFAFTLGAWLVSSTLLGMHDLSVASILVALFTICYEGSSREAAASAAISVVSMAFSYMASPSSNYASLVLFQNVSLSIAVALAGYAISVRNDFLEEANRRAQEAELLRLSEAERAREAETTRESEAARRVEEERVRIARELHDITGHSLSAVSIQAAAAKRLIDIDPIAAKAAMEEVRKTAKDALSDMRSMVGVLRSGEDAELHPTEGTDRMADLEGYLEAAGIDCDLLMLGYDRSRVPAHVDVALFGIAREACTNIVRHSGADKATIELCEDDDMVILRVCDDGRGIVASAMPDGGHGIAGMRERARLLDGELTIEPASVGGTCISVSIPASWKER